MIYRGKRIGHRPGKAYPQGMLRFYGTSLTPGLCFMGKEMRTFEQTSDIEFQQYLHGIAQEVERLVSANSQNKHHFVEHIKQFFKMRENHHRAVDEAKKNKPEAIIPWESLPVDPTDWFPYPGAPESPYVGISNGIRCDPLKLRRPNDSERLMCAYVLLGLIHDMIYNAPTDRPIYSDHHDIKNWLTTEGQIAGLLWSRITQQQKLYPMANAIQKRLIDEALRDVKADLASTKPKETEQKIEPQEKDGQIKADDIATGESEKQMSKPLSSAKWAVIFGVSRSTMRRWRKEKKYPFVQVSERKWSLPIQKLPGEYLQKYQQHSKPTKT